MDQAELTPALERVAASMVETHRKRQQVEEELKAASAAVASLHAQSSSLESSVVDLRRELEHALKARADEDKALAEIAKKQEAAAEQLDAIANDVKICVADKDRAAAEFATQAEATRERLRSIEAEVAMVKAALTTFQGDAVALKDRLSGIRQSTDAAQGKLTETQSKARELDGAVDGMAAKVCTMTGDLDQADRECQRVATAADELRAVCAVLAVRQAEAQKAAADTHTLITQRGKESASLAEHVARLGQLTAASATPQSAARESAAAQRSVQAAPASASSPATTPQTAPPQAVKAPSGSVNLPPPQTTGTAATTQGQATNAAMAAEAASAAVAARNGERKFVQSAEVITTLGSLGLIAPDESAAVLDVLQEEDVDKFVRTLWSRALGGPSPGPYSLIIASALGESGDHKGAMTFYNKALEGKHVDPFMIYLVAVGLLRMKRYVDVLRLAQGLGRAKNGKVLSRNVEALHLWGSGRLEEAEKKLAEAVTVPGQPRVHQQETMYNLARLAESRGDVSTAAMWFEKVAAADPGYRDVAVHMDALRTQAHSP